ncbi:nitrate/nitrite transporter NarK [Paenibacillus brasilensis]|uniref:Nitrate/nitrite transporter NarK n=1 Tax=Paenibacillus brasilensis TaxID=128574 RepID=A0ABU0L3B5_9BACL|nr:nitrate/nitrite transporter NarK [Paenibacillus brasilensis]
MTDSHLAVAGIMLAGIAFLPLLALVVVLLFVGMMCLGAGNGSVFQLVPQRFGNEIGLMTGIIGAAGGIGGYLLPLILGNLYKLTGSYMPGFICLSLITFCAFALVIIMQLKWRNSWMSPPAPVNDEATRRLGELKVDVQ